MIEPCGMVRAYFMVNFQTRTDGESPILFYVSALSTINFWGLRLSPFRYVSLQVLNSEKPIHLLLLLFHRKDIMTCHESKISFFEYER